MSEFADCTVVVLAHNGAGFTRHCLEGLLASRPRPRELVIVNNGSTDTTAALLSQELPRLEAAGIRIVTWANAENKGCSEARNEAWARATSQYVVFLDNDCVVCTRQWLALMIEEFARDPKLAILGPKLIYPFVPHPIQCAGVGINPLGRIRFRGRGANRWDPRYLRAARVPALISACWMMPRRLLDEVGGLDPLFHPVQYEDLDYCLQVAAHGYGCAYTPDVEMYHFEGRTTGAAGKATYVRTIAENSAKFRHKWRHVLRQLPPDPADYRWLPDEELGLTNQPALTLTDGPATARQGDSDGTAC